MSTPLRIALGRTALVMLGAATVAPPAPAQRAAVLRGRILSERGEQPIEGATISLADQVQSASSDSLGGFRLAGVPAGTHTVLVRRVGFAPFSSPVRFVAGDSVTVDFTLVSVAQMLPDVEVNVTVIERKLADFEERRKIGIGHFLTQQDIEKRLSRKFTDILRVLPGLKIVRFDARHGDAVFIASTRGTQTFLLQGSACPVSMMIDGVYVDQGPGNDPNHLIDPSFLVGVEYYAGPAQIPARFNATRNNCGLLVLWTK
jgi:Carboxypeptidase regulatory-like domain/TonB-dependent Receptor Plug Domain